MATNSKGDIFDQVSVQPTAKGDIFDQVGGQQPQLPQPKPAYSMQAAPPPSFMERMRRTVANSAIGHAVEQEFPKMADTLNLHPTETVYSPDYQAHQSQFIAPEYLMPNNPTSAAGNITRGALNATGKILNAPNLATQVGVAATGGLAAPLLEGTTAGAIASRAIKLGTGAQGVVGVGSGVHNAYNLYRKGDTAGAEQALGETLPNAAMMLPIAGEAAQWAGKKMQGAGIGTMNRSVLGVRKADIKRGANPGEAYFTAGNGPSLSMRSIANKGAASLERTGEQIASAIDGGTGAGTVIPGRDVAKAVYGPAANARQTMNGAFGPGSDALDQRMAGFNGKIQPEMTPRQVFDLKRQVADNVNWAEPTQVGVKQVGQQITGGLSGVLADRIPELQPLNRQYQGLTSLTNLANDRATTGQRSLTGMFGKAGAAAAGALAGGSFGGLKGAAIGAGAAALDSTPFKSTAASGLYYGGRGVSSLGNAINRGTSWMNLAGAVPGMGPEFSGVVEPPMLPSEAIPNADVFTPPRGYLTGGANMASARPPVVTPAPANPLALPASSAAGEAQPMIFQKPSVYPPLAEDFARMRVQPTRFAAPPEPAPLAPKGFLNPPKPSAPKARGKAR